LDDEVDSNQLVEEAKDKKKAYEQLKQQKSQQLSKALIIPSTPNMGIVNIPP